MAAVVSIDDLRLLEELEDRIDRVDAPAALAETKKKGAKSLDVILKDLGEKKRGRSEFPSKI